MNETEFLTLLTDTDILDGLFDTDEPSIIEPTPPTEITPVKIARTVRDLDTPEPTDEQIAALVAQGVNAASGLPGVRVEVIGTWVWVSGNTKPNKEALKANGFIWNHKRGMWYLPVTISHGRGRKDLWALRAKYGAFTVKDDTQSA